MGIADQNERDSRSNTKEQGPETSSSYIALVNNHAITNKDIIERIKLIALLSNSICDQDFINAMYEQTAYQMLDEALAEEKSKQLAKVAPKFFGPKVMQAMVKKNEEYTLAQMNMTKDRVTKILKEKGISYDTFYAKIKAMAYMDRFLEMRYQTNQNLHSTIQRKSKKEVSKYKKMDNNHIQIYNVLEIVIDNYGPNAKKRADLIMKKIQNGESFSALAMQYSQSPSRLNGGKTILYSYSMDPSIKKALLNYNQDDVFLGPIAIPDKNPRQFVILALLSTSSANTKNTQKLQKNMVNQSMMRMRERFTQEEKNKMRKEIKYTLKIPRIYAQSNI